MLNAREAAKRLQAVQTLLLEPSTTREKFNSVRVMIHGINPQIDAGLLRIEQHFSTWDKVESGDVIHLTADHLPENTEEEKRRKKFLFLFINSWKQLKSEIARVQQELQNSKSAQTTGEKASQWGRIFRAAKGPLGIITVLAVGVAVMHQTSVELSIQNKGCGTMYPSGSIPISIPGLSLPKEPIPSGGSAVATLPGLTINVDGTVPNSLALKVLTYSLSFQLPSNVNDVTMDDVSLLGKKKEIKLSEQDKHVLALICS